MCVCGTVCEALCARACAEGCGHGASTARSAGTWRGPTDGDRGVCACVCARAHAHAVMYWDAPQRTGQSLGGEQLVVIQVCVCVCVCVLRASRHPVLLVCRPTLAIGGEAMRGLAHHRAARHCWCAGPHPQPPALSSGPTAGTMRRCSRLSRTTRVSTHENRGITARCAASYRRVHARRPWDQRPPPPPPSPPKPARTSSQRRCRPSGTWRSLLGAGGGLPQHTRARLRVGCVRNSICTRAFLCATFDKDGGGGVGLAWVPTA